MITQCQSFTIHKHNRHPNTKGMQLTTSNHGNYPKLSVAAPSSSLSMTKTTNEEEKELINISEKMLSKHKQQSESITKLHTEQNDIDDTDTIDHHLQRQQEMFDDLSDFFNSDDATPEEVKPSLGFLMNQVLVDMMDCHDEGVERYHSRNGDANNNDDDDDENTTQKTVKDFKILDVGCGTGALFPFYLQQAKEIDENVNLHIMGLDLSPKMIQYAKTNSNVLLEETNTKGKHSFEFDNGDFVQLVLGERYGNDNQIRNDDTVVDFGQGVVSNGPTEKHVGKYDAVVINACFGNFYDPGKIP